MATFMMAKMAGFPLNFEIEGTLPGTLAPFPYFCNPNVMQHTCTENNFNILGHYANMSVQYTAIFHGCKNEKF